MAKTTTPRVETKQVSAQIPLTLFNILEDHRWDARLNMADLVRVAIEEYAAAHGLLGEETEASE